MNQSADLLTVPEFATRLRVKCSTIRAWIRQGRVSVIHIGRLVRLPASEVERIITAGTRPAKGMASR
jgi:excisionase family DNA binding protein